MFSVITNVYNKKTKGPTLMEVFTAPGKLKKFFFFFFLLEMFDVCTTGDTAHIDRNSSSCHTRVNMGESTTWFMLAQTPSFSKLCTPRTNGLVCRRVLAHFARNARCTVTTDLLVWNSNTQNDLSPERPFSHYIHSHRLAEEMWTTMKNNLLGKFFLCFSFFLYRFRKYVSYGFPIKKFCNPGVHYETPCIVLQSSIEILSRRNWPTFRNNILSPSSFF